MFANVLDAIRAQAVEHPLRVAIDDGTVRISWSTMYNAAMALAEQIAERMAPGQPVGIVLGNDARFPIAAFACAAAGCPYLAIDPRYPAARNAEIAVRAGVRLLITPQDHAIAGHGAPAALPRLTFRDASLACSAPDDKLADPPRPLGIDDPYVLLFTSGSAGVPKGFAHSQRSLTASMPAEIERFALTPEDRVLALWSPGTMGGVRSMLINAYVGTLSIVRDPQDGLTRVLTAFEENRVTVWRGVPALARAIARLDGARAAFSMLRIVHLGGDRTYASDIALLRNVLPSACRVSISYGSTEAGVVAQWFIEDGDVAPGPLAVGSAFAGVRFDIIDVDGTALAPGEIGELRSTSAATALALWDAGAPIAGSIATDPFEPAARIMHTGDLCWIGADGLLRHVGRVDRMIKLLGRRVDLGDIEAVLRADPDVADAAVITTSVGMGLRLWAYVVFSNPAMTAEALRARIQVLLPAHMVPNEIEPIDAIPFLPGFKHDIVSLSRLAAKTLENETSSAPAMDPALRSGTSCESVIARAVTREWSKLLGARSVASDTTWDEAGGDSMLMLQLAFALERRLGYDVPLEFFTSAMRRSDLIARLRLRTDAQTSSLSEGAPTVVVLPGIGGDEPKLVDFRTAFQDTAHVLAATYPPWQALVRSRESFEALVENVSAQIAAQAPIGPLALVGYSYGGIVGHTLAQRLSDAGRDIALLAIIDSAPAADADGLTQTDSRNSAPPSFAGRVRRFRMSAGITGLPAAIGLAIARRLAMLVMAAPRFRSILARRQTAFPLPRRMAFEFEYRMTQRFRTALARAREVGKYDGRAHLYIARDEASDGRDLVWRSLAPQIDKHVVDGTHATMILNEAGARLAQHVLRSIEETVSAA